MEGLIRNKESVSYVGTNIKKIRLDLGLKQNEMARKLEISPNFLSMIERGDRSPSLKLLKRISGISGKSMEDILGTWNSREAVVRAEDNCRALIREYGPEEVEEALKRALVYLGSDREVKETKGES